MHRLAPALFAALFLWLTTCAGAEPRANVGYQIASNPWKAGIADGSIERETGYAIRWQRYDSGAKVISAMVVGDLDVALAGSAPIAAAASRGVDVRLIWIMADIGDAEGLVVREGAGIRGLRDLAGRAVGVPFFSTSHYHLAFAFQHLGMDPARVHIRHLEPPQIASAWVRGDIDAAFVWHPVLGFLEQTGRVLITSGELSRWGRPTFDGLAANRAFAEENPGFLADLIRAIEQIHRSYRSNPAAWTPDSPMVQGIARLIGIAPAEVPAALALYDYPPLEDQLQCLWLGCGQASGAAMALRHTAEFLRAQGQIDRVLPDYAPFVTPEYARAAGRRD